MAIVLTKSFDTDTVLTGGWNAIEYPVGKPERLQLVTTSPRRGAQCVKVRLEKTDPQAQYGNLRAEFTYNNRQASTNTNIRWYRWSNKFPLATYANDTAEEVFSQWHDKDMNTSRNFSASPTLSFETKNGRFRLFIRYSVGDYATSTRTETSYDLGPMVYDQWLDWMVYYDPKYTTDGRVMVWLNGKQIFDYTGRCHYNGSYFPYWKVGIYKWIWLSNPSSSQTTVREFFLDEIMVGETDGSFMRFLMPGNQISFGDINVALGRARNTASSALNGVLKPLSNVSVSSPGMSNFTGANRIGET